MNTKLLIQGLALTTMLASAHLASAASVDICTGVTTKTMPDATIVTMWGYGLDTTPGVPLSPCNVTVPGPQIVVPDIDTTLTINLRNTLTEPTSIMVPGLRSTGSPAPVYIPDAQFPTNPIRDRARAMTHEAAPDGGSAIYGFHAAPGTYLYQSGSHPAVQVQMGLYGGVTKNTPTGNAYPMVPYNNEVVLLYSEIDPQLHTEIANGTYGDTNDATPYLSTINYVPKYFLVNGAPFVGGSTADILGGVAGETTLIRFLNAGLETHVPVLHGGSMDLIAEYGSPYPYPRKQYSFELAAGQSRDALFTPNTADRYAIYDRSLRLTNNMDPNGGLMSFLAVTAAPGTPVANADLATAYENIGIAALDLALNDTDTDGLDLNSINIPIQPVNGSVAPNNNGTGTVSFTPNANFLGTAIFSYTIRDSLGNISNSADVTITVSPQVPTVATTLVSPIGNMGASPVDTYTWNIVPSASDYRLLVVTPTGIHVKDELHSAASLSCNSTECSVLTTPLSGTYWWGIQAKNALGWGPWSTFIQFSAATASGSVPAATTLVSPTMSVAATSPDTYTWNEVTGATDYRLMVVTPAGVRLIDEEHTAASLACTTECSVTSGTSLLTGSYWWGIRAKNAIGWGPWSTFIPFPAP